MGYNKVKTSVMRYAGLNTWAQANGFIVLYPQASDCWAYMGDKSPKHAWSNKLSTSKRSPQLLVVEQMLRSIHMNKVKVKSFHSVALSS